MLHKVVLELYLHTHPVFEIQKNGTINTTLEHTYIFGHVLYLHYLIVLGKIIVKLSLCMLWRYMGEWRCSCTGSALDGAKCSASHPGHFSPGKEPPVPIK
jgi:hypothetical protein